MNDALYFSELCARRRGLLTLSQGALVRGLARLEDVGVAHLAIVPSHRVVFREAPRRAIAIRVAAVVVASKLRGQRVRGLGGARCAGAGREDEVEGERGG